MSKKKHYNAVMLHGYGGTSGFDRAFRDDSLNHIKWHSPISPRTITALDGTTEGRVWWYWDLAAIERRMLEGFSYSEAIDPLIAPRGLPSISEAILNYCDALPGGMERTIIGGMSQGAMAALDVALMADPTPAGVLLMSGGVVARDQWLELMPRLKDVPVLITHGTRDSTLPVDGARWLADQLDEAGAEVTWLEYRRRGHEMPDPSVVQAWMRRVTQ